MSNKWFVFGALGIALAALAGFMMFSNNQELTAPVQVQSAVTSAPESPTATGDVFIRPHSPRFGNSMARVTVVEWFDPECESCRAMHPAIGRIIADYSDRVQFVFRYMPYHSGSMFAASALEEAHELGKFAEALHILFERQPEWGDHHHPRPELIPTYLTEIGIPAENLNLDAVIAKHGEKVRMDEADGNTVGVQGTPTFFINGQRLLTLGEEPLRQAIDQALAKATN